MILKYIGHNVHFPLNVCVLYVVLLRADPVEAEPVVGLEDLVGGEGPAAEGLVGHQAAVPLKDLLSLCVTCANFPQVERKISCMSDMWYNT